MWMLYRVGRIIVFNVYKVCYLREFIDLKVIVKFLMNYNLIDKVGMVVFLEWGYLKEVVVKELYKKKMVVKYEDFIFLDCGLVVSEEYFFLGVSFDGMRYCKCCGIKLVEVKVIYLKKNLRLFVVVGEKIIYD